MSSLFAASRLNDVEALEALLQCDPQILDDRDDSGATSLHICASAGSYECAQVLLKYGANIHLKDFESGWTPLHRALYSRHLRVSLLLIKAGALLGDSICGSNGWKANVQRVKDVANHLVVDNDGLTPLDLLSFILTKNLNDARKPEKMNCTSVLTFGKADFQLGIPLPNNQPDVLRAKSIEALQQAGVCQISAAKYHSLALNKKGAVYSWGHGRSGRLGHGDETTVPIPQLVSGLSRHLIVCISVAENHSLALSRDGELFAWGSNRFGQLGLGARAGVTTQTTPLRVQAPALRKVFVTGLAAGEAHSLCFSSDGDVFSWGSNKSGQLGLPLATSSSDQPHLVLFSGFGKKDNKSAILQITAGQASSLLLRVSPRQQQQQQQQQQLQLQQVEENVVYQWGHGNASPTVVLFPRSGGKDKSSLIAHVVSSKAKIVQIASGNAHNCAISADGHVFSWGLGSDILGHGTTTTHHLTHPTLLECLLPENGGGKAVSVTCSASRTCVLSAAGDLYTWGVTEKQGVLGHGQGSRFEPLPKRVVGVKRAVSVAAGENHTIVLISATTPPLPLHGFDFADEDESGAVDERVDVVGADLEDEEDATEDDINTDSLTPPSTAAPQVFNPPTLKQLCEHSIAQEVYLKNAIFTLANAETLDSPLLAAYCYAFILANLDAILVSSKPATLDVLTTEMDLSRYNCYASFSSVASSQISSSATASASALSQALAPSSAPAPGQGQSQGQTPSKAANQRKRGGSEGGGSFDLTLPDGKRDRSGSINLTTVEGVQKLIRSNKKKLQHIAELEAKMKDMPREQMQQEQLDKMERKALLQSELKRLNLILVRLEAEQRVRMAAESKREVAASQEVDEGEKENDRELSQSPSPSPGPVSAGERSKSCSELDVKKPVATGPAKAAATVKATPSETQPLAPSPKKKTKFVPLAQSALAAPPSFGDWGKMVAPTSTPPPVPAGSSSSTAVSSMREKAWGSLGSSPSPSPSLGAASKPSLLGQQLEKSNKPSSPPPPPPSMSAILQAEVEERDDRERRAKEAAARKAAAAIAAPAPSAHTTPSKYGCPWGSPAASPAATSPSPLSGFLSLAAIQEQEERKRQLSNMRSLQGHENPWFLERRLRADSLDKVMRQEEESLRLEREKELERAAIAAARDSMRKSSSSHSSNARRDGTSRKKK